MESYSVRTRRRVLLPQKDRGRATARPRKPNVVPEARINQLSDGTFGSVRSLDLRGQQAYQSPAPSRLEHDT